MQEVHFKRVKDDGFQAVDPDSLMTSVSQSNLRRTLLLSIAAHLIVILVLSLGNMGLCFKYRTLNLKQAIRDRETDAKAAIEQQQADEAEARKVTLQKKAAEKKRAAATTKSNPPEGASTGDESQKETSAIVQEINEVSNLRPEASSLDSIDDLFEN